MTDTKTTETKTGATVKTAVPAATTPVTAPASLTDRQKKIMNITSISSSIGLVGGLGYAFAKKKGFWSYVGYGLLFSIIGGTIGGVGAQVIVKKEDKSL
jgi:hypothetical protein